jgi:tetratricopeptide (TPR) repeat protein
MKHCAAYSEGFAPCALGPSISLPPLQVSLQDARATLQRAHIQAGSRALGHGLALAQEAAALYQKVTESAAHPGVIECVDLMATILLEAGDPASAAANGIKALGLTVQSSGFDSANVFICHMTLFEMLSAAGDLETCIKNLRAAIFLLEVMGGHNHLEHFTAYHKLAGVYSHSEYGGKYLQFALELFTEASKRDSPDRLMEGITAKNFAQVLAGLENYKGAMEYEKKALRTLTMFCGKEHHFTRESEADFRNYVKLAVEKGSRRQQNERMLEQTAKAEAVAADLAAEEESKKKKHSRMKKKKHKK